MLRIVDGNGKLWNPRDGIKPGSGYMAFLGTSSDRYKVKAMDFGNGHCEVAASRVIDWSEAEWPASYLVDVMEVIVRDLEQRDQEEVDLANRKRAARRAKTRVRRLCKLMGADTLLTLTYRGWQPDLDTCKRHLKEFNRRMLRVLPGFCFVACFEQQKPNLQIGRPVGSWHAHLATRNIPASLPGIKGEWRSFNVIRAIWRSVTGELGGNIDLQRRKYNSNKSAAQVAAYIAKYIGKGFEEGGLEAGKNRWTKYGQVDQPLVIETEEASLLDAVQASYAFVQSSQAIATARLDDWKEWFFVAGELRPKRTDRCRSAMH